MVFVCIILSEQVKILPFVQSFPSYETCLREKLDIKKMRNNNFWNINILNLAFICIHHSLSFIICGKTEYFEVQFSPQSHYHKLQEAEEFLYGISCAF